ncbi:MAG TPA: hypothetical protein VFC09_06485 [Candidatus Dormibacteraeota bacterium]|nr:hypothetical protein [Candidatus Dormibacteraeota bacterium]
MTRVHIHKSPPAPIVAELVRAGVSLETAQAMERWKAEEVLELLRYRPDAGAGALKVGKGVAGAC